MRTIRFAVIALLLAAPAAAQDFSGIVREEKQKLLDAGYQFHVSTGDAGSERGRCDAAQITWRAAYRLAQEGHPVFLIGKGPGQNGCTAPNGQRYSHDAIVMGGFCVDVLQNSETENIPVWNICTSPIAEPSIWRPTFALDPIGEPKPKPKPTPEPQPQPGPVLTDLSGLSAQIDTAIQIALRAEQKMDAYAAIEAQRWLEAKGVWDEYLAPMFKWMAQLGGPAAIGAFVMRWWMNRTPATPAAEPVK